MTEVAKMIEPAYSSAHPRKRTKPPSMAQPCPPQIPSSPPRAGFSLSGADHDAARVAVLAALRSIEEGADHEPARTARPPGCGQAAVDKIGGETTALVSEVATLKEALANAGVTSPEVDAAVAAIEERVKAVDDLVPDAAPPVEPTP